MIEVFVTSNVIASSVFLLSHWFRYTSLLIFARRTSPGEIVSGKQYIPREIRSMLRKRALANVDHVCAVAVENQLSFPEVQVLLRESADIDLDHLRESLDRDYTTVVHLLNRDHVALRAARYERLMLASNYRLLKVWYFMRRRFRRQAARDILEEMSWVVGYFAEAIG